MQPLYTYQGKDITVTDFSDALRKIGVQKGDIIFVHSDIKPFGKLAVAPLTLLAHLVEVFQASVGESGTVIVPTFSYSFGKKEIFDVEKTRSVVGALTEFFRTQPGVGRTIQPMHSVAVWGAQRLEFLETAKDSFGPGTVFEKLHTMGGKIVLFGVTFRSCTFLHYIEQMHEVPYRFMKTFRGTIVDGGSTYEDEFTYYARPLDSNVENNMDMIEPIARAAGIVHEAKVGGGKILLVTAKDLYDVGMRELDADPDFLLADHI